MRLTRILVLSCIVLLLPMQGVHAQGSFFDVFFDLDSQPGQLDLPPFGEISPPLPDTSQFESFFGIFSQINIPELTECNPCDVLKAELEAAQEEAAELEDAFRDVYSSLHEASQEHVRLERSLREAEHLLSDLTDPRSWAESGGKRIDTSDLRVMETYNAELWESYKSGLITSNDYQQRLTQGLTGEEREGRRQEMIKNIRKQVKDLKGQLKETKEKEQGFSEQADALEELFTAVRERTEDLLRKLEECLKRCTEEQVNVIDDFGMGQAEGPNLLERLFGWIVGYEPEPPADTPADDLGFPPLDVPLPSALFPPGFLDSLSIPPSSGFSPEIVLPPFPLVLPECAECDELLQMIQEMEDELEAVVEDLDTLNDELLEALLDEHNAERRRDEAQKRLEAFTNPRSSAQSGGRSITSADLEVMRDYNRSLWQQYRSGDLTAQELEQKWEEGLPDAEREQMKEQQKQELEQELADAQKELEEASARVKNLLQLFNETLEVVNDLLEELQELEEEYDECIQECTEEKEIKLGGFGVFLSLPDGLQDGSESGAGGTVTFGDGVVIQPGQPIDVNDLLKKSDQFDPQTGELDLGGIKFEFDDQNYLVPSGGEADVSLGLPEEREDKGFFCGTFGLFCPKAEELPPLAFGDFVGCVVSGSQDPSCTPFDANEDGAVDLADAGMFHPFLQGPGSMEIDLNIHGMDGNDAVSVPDLQLFGDCLRGAPGTCDGLGVTLRGGGGEDTPFGVGDFGLGLSGGPGNDILFSDPLDNLIGVQGNDNLAGGPFPPDFFGPGSGPLDDFHLFGPGGEPIPVPQLPVPGQMQNFGGCLDGSLTNGVCQEVPILRVDLQPGEKLQCSVTVIRVGNKRIIIVKCRKVREGVQCPREQYPTADTCRNACPRGQECVLNEQTKCFTCMPAVPACPDLAYTEQSVCQRECMQGQCQARNVEGAQCYFCVPVEYPDDCVGNGLFNDTTSCLLECESQSCVVTDDGCVQCLPLDHEDFAACPDGQWTSYSQCNASCPNGSCKFASRLGDNSCFVCGQCPSGTYYNPQDCMNACNGVECVLSNSAKIHGEKGCYECKPVTTPQPQQCDAPTKTEAQCQSSCNGTCVKSYTRDDGVKCYECVPSQTPSCPDDAVSSCSECPSGSECYTENDCIFCRAVDPGPTCPSGTTGDRSVCEAQCAPRGGTCVLENSCYSCIVFNCPSGTYKNECPGSCANGCTVVGEQGGVKCYQCKQSCEDVCAGLGLEVAKDYTSYILGELNGYTCVSGANISVQRATSGDCECLSVPQITVDTTPPVCRGTPCGDVACGSQQSCSGGENTTITVTCNWGGWEKIDEFRFRPIVGQ